MSHVNLHVTDWLGPDTECMWDLKYIESSKMRKKQNLKKEEVEIQQYEYTNWEKAKKN